MGHFTDMTEGPRFWDSKISHWSRRSRPSKFTSSELDIMDEKSTWIPT